MTTVTHLLTLRGDTKPAKEVLKQAGWKWNPELRHWYMRLVAAHADRVRAGDKVFMFDSLRINRKGCQACLDGSIVWSSKTFCSPDAPVSAGMSHAGDPYNHDAFGNPVDAKRILGSAPDDMI